MPDNFQIPSHAKVYLNKPYVQLFWDRKDQILTSRWKGFCSYEEIAAIGKRIMDAVIFEKARKIIFDARDIEVLDSESQAYISGPFTIEMIRAGVAFSATVFPEDIFAKFSVDDIQKKLEKNSDASIRYFNSLALAAEWLNEQK